MWYFFIMVFFLLFLTLSSECTRARARCLIRILLPMEKHVRPTRRNDVCSIQVCTIRTRIRARTHLRRGRLPPMFYDDREKTRWYGLPAFLRNFFSFRLLRCQSNHKRNWLCTTNYGYYARSANQTKNRGVCNHFYISKWNFKNVFFFFF